SSNARRTPAWSRRAAAAPALGLPSSTRAAPEHSPGAAQQRRVRYRSPLDAALAMQLRPGLGVGADGAWLVRFLMSFFGWFAVLVAKS
ncbi:hypothetical protein K438DRAFT_1479506, partial [Mycena galopus ATCC 62051]